MTEIKKDADSKASASARLELLRHVAGRYNTAVQRFQAARDQDEAKDEDEADYKNHAVEKKVP